MIKTRNKRRRCPNGYRKDNKTNKCKKKKLKQKTKKIIRLPKSRRQRVVVKINVKKKGKKMEKSKKRKRCKNGFRKNKKSGICEPVNKEEIIPNTTPLINKSIRKSIAHTVPKRFDLTNYSPSINRQLKTLKTLSPIGVQGCTIGSEVMVKLKNGKTKCYGWDTKTAKKIMLNNLISKKPIDCSNITAPKQFQANCWFNSFFMTFFISDYGRKFNRWLREAMITGKLANGTNVLKKLQKPLFAFNKYINASLRSSYDDGNFAKLMDTNYIIKSIYSAIGKKINASRGETIIAPTNRASNPLTFYTGLYQVLGGDLMKWLKITVGRGVKKITDLKNIFEKHQHEAFAKVIYLEMFDDESSIFHKPKEFIIKRNENGQTFSYTYRLDAAVLRNTEQFHFSAYITCNGKDYGFDGESFGRMQPFKWKTKLNRNSKWKFAEQYETYFNFKKGYQLLIYYLVKREFIR